MACIENKSLIILYELNMVFKRPYPSYIVIFEGLHEENTFQSIVCGCTEPNREKDSVCIFIKKNENISEMIQSFQIYFNAQQQKASAFLLLKKSIDIVFG